MINCQDKTGANVRIKRVIKEFINILTLDGIF